MLWVHFSIVLACIVLGARVGGVGLGSVAGVGLAVLVFAFRMPAGKIPVDVIFMILTVITAVATMQAAGGLDLLVSWAAKLMRKRPRAITFVAPAISYVFTVMCGTEHVVYSLLPVIAEVSLKAGVRPERPMSISVIAAQQGVTASPISAATAGMIALLAASGSNLGLFDILKVVVPASICGIAAAAVSVMRRGVELRDDGVYLQRLANGDVTHLKEDQAPSDIERKRAILAIGIFLFAACTIVICGLLPSLRPFQGVGADAKRLGMASTIEIVMLAAVTAMILLARVNPEAIVSNNRVMKAGSVALVSIFGIAWLGSTFFEGHNKEIVGAVSGFVQVYPWVFALGLFGLSILLYSQAATVAALMHVGVHLGIPLSKLIGMYPAVNGFFFLPTYGTMVAAISFDSTGSTQIGRWVFNHSFMRPGLVATIATVAASLFLSQFI